jgi:hypothetical protein
MQDPFYVVKEYVCFAVPLYFITTDLDQLDWHSIEAHLSSFTPAHPAPLALYPSPPPHTLYRFVFSHTPQDVMCSLCLVCCRHDPHREVVQSVSGARTLYGRWQELLETSNTAEDEEFKWTTHELKRVIKSIEWDLLDLDETIDILFVLPNFIFENYFFII